MKKQNHLSFINNKNSESNEKPLDLEQYAWLESCSEDKWYFTQPPHASSNSTYTVTWSPQKQSLTTLDKARWSKWVEYGQSLTIWVMESDDTDCRAIGSIVGIAREIRSLTQWLYFSCGLTSISELTHSHIENYKQYIKSLDITKNSVISKFVIFQYMVNATSDLGVGPSVSPFKYLSLAKLAGTLGGENKRTKTIPPDMFLELLNGALKNIDGCEKDIVRLNGYIALKEQGFKHVAAPYKRRFSDSSGDMFKRIEVIYTSAIIILFSLTAMRKHEATSVTYDDALLMLEENENLRGRVFKTAMTSTGKETERPLNAEGRNALEVIIKITSFKRAAGEHDGRLLLKMPFKHSKTKASKGTDILTTDGIYTLLRNYSKKQGLPLALTPHMFRRAFALMWTWRFEIGDLAYLSKVLNHNDLKFTRIYTDDNDAIEFLPQEIQQYTHHVFRKSLLGESEVYGGFGKILTKYKNLLIKTVTVIGIGALDNFIKKIIDQQEYTVIPNADGYCFMSKGRKHRALCSTNQREPDYSNRCEELCSKCPNFGVTDQNISYWEKRRRMHQNVYENTNVEILKAAAREGVKRADRIIHIVQKD